MRVKLAGEKLLTPRSRLTSKMCESEQIKNSLKISSSLNNASSASGKLMLMAPLEGFCDMEKHVTVLKSTELHENFSES
jgi:hypothetical protein